MDLLRKLRPGSGFKAPVSETLGPNRKKLAERRRPNRGPGETPNGSPDGFNPGTQSWPIVIATDIKGNESSSHPRDEIEEAARRLESADAPEAEEWKYEQDDPEVLWRLAARR